MPRSLFGLRAIALMLSVENFIKGGNKFGYGVEDNMYLCLG